MKSITPHFYVAEQLTPDDLVAASQSDIKHVICNRPDHEAEEQPNHELIQAAAQQVGIEFHFLPVIPGEFSESDVAAFRELIANSSGKVLAYCRTGTRSLSLWTLANVEHKSKQELLNLAESAGYNMSGLIDRVVE